MTAHGNTPRPEENVTEKEAQSDGDEEEEVFFEEDGGLFTHANLAFNAGNFPVRVKIGGPVDESVILDVSLGAGSVAVQLNLERALQLSESLEDAALQIHNRKKEEENDA